MLVNLKNCEFRKILTRRNMSQNRFAMKLGISSGYMSQLMCGFRNPSPDLREKILAELKMDESRFDDLFEIKETI